MTRISALALDFSQLQAWRRRIAAIGLGLLATLAMPPVSALPLLWLAFPGLVWLLDGAKKPRTAFADGWWFGFGHFSAGVYWIAYALLVDPLKFGWMIPFAVFGLGALLANFTALVALAAWRLAPAGFARILVLAAGWGFFEWVRSWFFTGFPWNLLGSVWLPLLPVAQFAAVAGTMGLGIVTVIIAALPALVTRRTGALAPLAAILLLGLLAGWGGWRLSTGAPAPTGVTLRLVQPNIAQTLKWAPEMRLDHLKRHLALSARPGLERVNAVIWPETAAPSFLERDPVARSLMAQVTPPGGLLITGVLRATPPGVEPLRIWNSLVALDGSGQRLATYDKAHLVPFGEYVPLHRYLPLDKITPGGIDLTPGDGPETLELPGLPPVGPQICYEVIFPGAVIDRAHRPQWMLNLTNDGWYGISAGPYQHLAAVRMRAIEEALPLVRAANTGISAVIDPYGRELAAIPLGEEGILDYPLPGALPADLPFARFGNLAFWGLLVLTTIMGLLWARLFRAG